MQDNKRERGELAPGEEMDRTVPEDGAEETQLPYMYDEKEMETVETHISDYFGEFSMVMHEIFSPDVHVDICLIPPHPEEERNFYTLVTMGMGAYRMNVPEELAKQKLTRAELLIKLPPDWHMEQEAFQDERWYWPIRLLKTVARLPMQEDSWIGWGHTVGMEEGETYAENTKLCGCMVVSAEMPEEDSFYCELENGDDVNFYQLLPLYEEEMEFKLVHGAQALLDRFPEEMFAMVDIARPNVISGQ